MMTLFGSDATPNLTSHKMVKKLHLCMQPTNRYIKVANCALEKSVGKLKETPISIRELIVPIDFLVLEETP